MPQRKATLEVLKIMQTLWAFTHALEARSKRMHRDLGVTGPQRMVLRMVGESPGCTSGEAARTLSLDPGTVSRLVSGLKRLGLVRREIDSLDRRKQRLFLTRHGVALKGQRRGTVEAAVRDALAEASTSEVESARKFIRRLTESLAVPEARR